MEAARATRGPDGRLPARPSGQAAGSGQIPPPPGRTVPAPPAHARRAASVPAPPHRRPVRSSDRSAANSGAANPRARSRGAVPPLTPTARRRRRSSRHRRRHSAPGHHSSCRRDAATRTVGRDRRHPGRCRCWRRQRRDADPMIADAPPRLADWRIADVATGAAWRQLIRLTRGRLCPRIAAATAPVPPAIRRSWRGSAAGCRRRRSADRASPRGGPPRCRRSRRPPRSTPAR